MNFEKGPIYSRSVENPVIGELYSGEIENLASSFRREIEEEKTPFAKFYRERALAKTPTTHEIFKVFVGELLRELKVVPNGKKLDIESGRSENGHVSDLIVSARGFEPLAVTLRSGELGDLEYQVKSDTLDYEGEKIDLLELEINPDLWIEAIATFRARIDKDPKAIPSVIEARDYTIENGDFGTNFIAVAPNELASAIKKR